MSQEFDSSRIFCHCVPFTAANDKSPKGWRLGGVGEVSHQGSRGQPAHADGTLPSGEIQQIHSFSDMPLLSDQ